MKLQEQLKDLTEERDKCETIAAYLKTVNPVQCDSMAVWQSGNRFLCQSHIDGEFYGHVFVVDIENENLCPV
ncbi:hypothetical protein KAR91_02780 [Candidatus Pacearchaeota archaeon]|nr:hypothetical protein [Candidatus Pacearchaeota archaeon]